MATNPMQRQARNSFLLGMVVTLVIAALIVVFLFMQIKNLNEELEEEQALTVSVYVLNQDVTSGQTITTDMFTLTQVKSSGVPSDATSDVTTLLNTYSLCDNEGNNIYTDADGNLYMMDGNTEVPVYQESATGSYYTESSNGDKTYIETTQKALIAKVDLKAKTVLSASYIARTDEITTDDVREQEYNSIVLPTELMTGDYVDIRLLLPNGQDYIVISKKQVTVPIVNGEYLTDTIQMNLSEEEILTMSGAIVEAYKIDGSKLYATVYTEAGLQEASTPTYTVNSEIRTLINNDPNIVSEAKTALSERYNTVDKDGVTRNTIESAISTYGDEDAVADGMDESITSTQESRQEYLQSLMTITTTTN